MNSIPLALDKLASLIDLAAKADTDFEKAAVFGAVTALVQDLDPELGDSGNDRGELLELVRWYSCALVGYDISNGKDKTALHVGALGAIQSLRDSLLEAT